MTIIGNEERALSCGLGGICVFELPCFLDIEIRFFSQSLMICFPQQVSSISVVPSIMYSDSQYDPKHKGWSCKQKGTQVSTSLSTCSHA